MTMPHDSTAAEAAADYSPIHVHVASIAAGTLPGPAPATPAKRYRTVYRTVHLTASDNGKEIWAASDAVEYALVRALDDDITIAKAKNDAVDGNGSVIPKADTGPTMIRDSGVAWCANATGTFSGGSSTYSRLSVIAVYRA